MSSRLAYYYPGLFILLCMILGGGTFQPLWTDHVLQVFALPLMLCGFWMWGTSALSPPAKTLIVLAIILMLFQFLPISRDWPAIEGYQAIATTFLTPVPARTLEAMLITFCLLGFALYLSNMPEDRFDGLTRFFIIGLIANAGIALMQLSFSDDIRQESALPYAITAGFFANENHFSTMVFAMIPLLAWRQLGRTARPFLFLGAVLLLALIQFAVGSRLGMAMTVVMAVLSVLFIFGHGRRWKWKLMGFLALLGFFVILGGLVLVGMETIDPSRAAFWARGWNAFTDHFLLGTGLGSFPMVHPMYEAANEITGEFGVRMHNDVLQLMLEFGILVLPLFALFGYLVLTGFRAGLQHQLFAMAISAIVIHSLVDFPLRTFAVSIFFVYLLVFVARQQAPKESRQIDPFADPYPIVSSMPESQHSSVGTRFPQL